MVQNRMNRIRQELAQSNRQAGVTIPRRLIYVKAVEAAGEYDSCGDDCSSYDSYSSSGSECSDCEVCRPPRCLEIPQLKGPKGLGRREVAVDLAFLFPPSDHSRDGHQASHDGEMDREVPTNVRQYNSEGEDPFLPSSYRNQQYMIDHLNEERRRKRRVLDREMQSKVAYKKHLGNTRGDGGPSQDMDVDQNQDLIPMDRESTSQSAIELSSRPQSPDLTGSPQHARSSKRAKNFQPRFLPGFGPDGLKAVKRPVEPLPVPAPTPRYPMPDRYARTWDSNYYNNAEYFGTAEDDTRSYPSVEKGLSGQHRGRPSRETNWGNLSQVYVQQHLRQQELEDAAYRSKNTHSQSQARPSPMALTTPRQPAPEDVYPFDSERRFKFKQVFPQKQFMSPSPRPSRPPPPEPVRHQNPRGRPSKNSRAIPWAGPLDHQGHTHTGNQSPHRHPSVSPRATQASVGGSSKIMPSMRRYEAPGMSVDAEPEQHRHAAGFKRTPHARADITPYDQFVPMYSSSAPSTPSMPPPARSSSTSTTPQHQGHPYSAEQSPMLAYQQFQRQQQRSISHHRPGPGGIREFAGPIITDLTSPSNSPKQSFTGVPSPDLTVASVSTNTVNGDHQNGFTGAGMGQTLPRQSMSMSPIQKAPKSHPGVRG
ncbi:hypothetical protein EDD11_003622 [Mortierella claussenii]|nr:hypothetical protein EDD11_003622 [Mortierella claussenii]